MKFSAVALSTLAVLSLAEARRTLGAKALEKSLNSVDKSALLKSARKLQNDNNGNNQDDEDFGITGKYSVRFNSCVSVELDEEEANQNNREKNYENNQYYEQATAVKQMLVVDLVSSDSSSSNVEVAMDIGTYVNSVGRMVYEQVESYCSVCLEIESNCYNDQDGSQSNWLSEQASKYLDQGGSTVEYVDCETCELYNCYGNQDDENRKLQEDNDDMENAFTYLEELSQCQAFSVNYQNSEYAEEGNNGEYNQDEDQDQYSQSLYIGYKCSEYGNGIELSFFLDEDCTLATEEVDVAENIPENSMAGQYLEMSQNLVNGIFENSFSCKNIEFVSPYNGDENNNTWYNFQYYTNNADADEEIPEANDYCQSIFEDENTMTLDCQGMTSSVANGGWFWMNNGNSQNETDYSDYDEEAAQYDEDDVCEAIRTTSKTAWRYRQNNYNIYNSFGNNNQDQDGNNEQASGYDYRSFGQYNEDNRVAASRSYTTGDILMYLGIAAAIIALIAFFTQKKKASDEAKKQSLILEGDAGDYKAEGEIA